MADDQNNKRDAIPKLVSLSSEDKDRISRDIREELHALTTDRQEWLAKQEEFLYGWDDYVTPNRVGPWEGSANSHIPVTMQQVRGFHAMMYSILFDTYPSFITLPTKPSDIDKREFAERFMIWVTERLANRNDGIAPTIDRWVWDCITMGYSVVKLRYVEEREKFVDVQPGYELLQDTATGMPVMMPTDPVEVIEERVTYSGPVVENIDPLDFYITPGCTISTSPLIVQRVRLRHNDLKSLAEKGTFEKKAVEELLESEGTNVKHTGPESSTQQIRDDLGGVNTNTPNQKNQFFRILECYRLEDVNNDGYKEKIVAWIEEESGKFLGWNFVNKLYDDGRPPYYDMKFIPRGDQTPMGLVELLHPLNNEIDALHNLRIDSLSIQNVPWGTIKESRKVKSDNIQIAPGVFIPVQEHDDLQIKSQPYGQAGFAQEEERLVRHAETLGMSSLGFGQTPGQIGPLATATGATTMMQQMHRIMSVHVHRVRQAFAQLLKGIYGLSSRRIPLDTVFHVLGEDGRPVFQAITDRSLFASGIEFSFAPTTAALNKDLERQSAILWLQTASNPLAIQLGVTTPATFKEAFLDVAKALGKVNVSKYVNNPGTEPQAQTLQEEISFLLAGIKPVIVLNDNHEAKIQGIMAHIESPDMDALAQRDPNRHMFVRAALEQGLKLHQEMLQAIQAQNQSGNLSGLNQAPTVENRRAGMPTSAESPEGQPAPVGAGPGMTPGVTGSVSAEEVEPQ